MEKDQILTIVRALVLNQSNEIILLKRNSTRAYNKNQWELPGGKMIKKFSLNDAIEQKANDELSFIIRVASDDYYCQSRIVAEEGRYQGFVYLEITAQADYISGFPKINRKQHSDFKWVNIFRAQELDLSPESKRAISNYIYKKFIAPEKQKRVKVVGRALIKKGDKYLVLRRSQGESLFPGKWELPGGKLDSFELLEGCLRREVFEETGLLVDIKWPALHINSRVANEINHEGITYIEIISEAVVQLGRIKLGDEHDKYQWVKKKEILNLDLPPHIKMQLTELLLGKIIN